MSNSNRRFLDADRLALAPDSEIGAQDLYTSEVANFDTSMVVILAALLTALIFALGLNSIVRCALRCSRRLGPEVPGRTVSAGLKKDALRQIPVAVYGGAGVGIPATECAICLGEFQDGEKVRVLPKCNHGFHMRCIDTWLASHPSCPNCRNSLLDQPMPPASMTTAGDQQV